MLTKPYQRKFLHHHHTPGRTVFFYPLSLLGLREEGLDWYFAIVACSYCGAREFVRASRKASPDDLLNSAIAGFGSGAILGHLQAGQLGAIRYSVIFAVVGTTVDYATLKLRPTLEIFRESVKENLEKSGGWLKLPECSPVRVLNEEALDAKKAWEEKLRAQTNLQMKEEA